MSSEGRHRVRRRLVWKYQRAWQRQLGSRQELRQEHSRQAGHRRGQGARRHGRVWQRRIRAVLSQLALQHPGHHRGHRQVSYPCHSFWYPVSGPNDFKVIINDLTFIFGILWRCTIVLYHFNFNRLHCNKYMYLYL